MEGPALYHSGTVDACVDILEGVQTGLSPVSVQIPATVSVSPVPLSAVLSHFSRYPIWTECQTGSVSASPSPVSVQILATVSLSPVPRSAVLSHFARYPIWTECQIGSFSATPSPC